MKVVFRVDASTRMGMGHIMRCLALAEALRARGVNVSFVSRAHMGHMINTLTGLLMPVAALPAPVTLADNTENYSAWLGVTQAVDAAETITALNGDQPDWLIVDHYGLDIQWEKTLRPHVGKILVIDDLANRLHDCDVLLDQNYSTRDENRYAKLVPSCCRCLLGPRYALLRPEYAAYRKTLLVRNGQQVRRVLVFLGGSDPANITGMILAVLSSPDLQELQVDVITGANNPHLKSIERQVSIRPHTTLHKPRPHLADLMVQSDISIGAGGITTWERLCLGLPSVVISTGENQVPACESLSNSGLIYYLGSSKNLQTESILISLSSILKNNHALEDMSSRGRILVDGLGTLRLAEFIDPSSPDQLRLRPAEQWDMELYFDWVNETEVRRHSINCAPIFWRTHEEWFRGKLADNSCRMFVLEAGRLPVGQVRFDITSDEAGIDYSLDTLVRNRRWAGKMINMGIHLVQESLPVAIRSKVKEENKVSCAVFNSLGFMESASPTPGMRFFTYGKKSSILAG